jgi:hypothetical protein
MSIDPSSQQGTPGRNVLHLGYQVDLENPTEESLAAIKNTIIEKITRSVAEETRLLGEETDEALPSHDKHASSTTHET